MLYEGNNPIIKIIGVEHMCWEQGYFNVAPRTYSALVFRISGSARITANEKDYYINSNDIMYLPQNLGYTAEYTDTETIVFHFETQFDDKEIEIYSLLNTEQAYKLFITANNLWLNKEPGYTVYTTAQLYLILGLLLESNTKASQPEYFLKAISFINSNFKENSLCVDAICNESGIGATQLRKLFNKYYNKTPTQYITELRLEYARTLISNGISIKSAAYESGFNDTKYFARVVKKYFNCTPSKLKEYGK